MNKSYQKRRWWRFRFITQWIRRTFKVYPIYCCECEEPNYLHLKPSWVESAFTCATCAQQIKVGAKELCEECNQIFKKLDLKVKTKTGSSIAL